jgi:hypothetical protein
LTGGVKGATYLEHLLFSLEDDKILTITGSLPDPSRMRSLDYSILNEVIGYIMKMPLAEATSSDIKFPDWDKKIKFNGLSAIVAAYLNSSFIQTANLTEYLTDQGNFLAEDLRNKINEIYVNEKTTFYRR